MVLPIRPRWVETVSIFLVLLVCSMTCYLSLVWVALEQLLGVIGIMEILNWQGTKESAIIMKTTNEELPPIIINQATGEDLKWAHKVVISGLYLAIEQASLLKAVKSQQHRSCGNAWMYYSPFPIHGLDSTSRHWKSPESHSWFYLWYDGYLSRFSWHLTWIFYLLKDWPIISGGKTPLVISGFHSHHLWADELLPVSWYVAVTFYINRWIRPGCNLGPTPGW